MPPTKRQQINSIVSDAIDTARKDLVKEHYFSKNELGRSKNMEQCNNSIQRIFDQIVGSVKKCLHAADLQTPADVKKLCAAIDRHVFNENQRKRYERIRRYVRPNLQEDYAWPRFVQWVQDHREEAAARIIEVLKTQDEQDVTENITQPPVSISEEQRGDDLLTLFDKSIAEKDVDPAVANALMEAVYALAVGDEDAVVASVRSLEAMKAKSKDQSGVAEESADEDAVNVEALHIELDRAKMDASTARRALAEAESKMVDISEEASKLASKLGDTEAQLREMKSGKLHAIHEALMASAGDIKQYIEAIEPPSDKILEMTKLPETKKVEIEKLVEKMKDMIDEAQRLSLYYADWLSSTESQMEIEFNKRLVVADSSKEKANVQLVKAKAEKYIETVRAAHRELEASLKSLADRLRPLKKYLEALEVIEEGVQIDDQQEVNLDTFDDDLPFLEDLIDEIQEEMGIEGNSFSSDSDEIEDEDEDEDEDVVVEVEEQPRSHSSLPPKTLNSVENVAVTEVNAEEYRQLCEATAQLPYTVEFTPADVQRVRQFEDFLVAMNSKDATTIRAELGMSNFEGRDDRQTKMMDDFYDHLADGSFLKYMRLGFITLGAMRDGDEFAGRSSKFIGPQAAWLIESRMNAETSRATKAFAQLANVIHSVPEKDQILPEGLFRRYRSGKGKYSVVNKLESLGETLSQVWTAETIYRGIYKTERLAAIHEKTQKRTVEDRKKAEKRKKKIGDV